MWQLIALARHVQDAPPTPRPLLALRKKLGFGHMSASKTTRTSVLGISDGRAASSLKMTFLRQLLRFALLPLICGRAGGGMPRCLVSGAAGTGKHGRQRAHQ